MAAGLQDRNDGIAWQRRTWFNTFAIAMCLVVIGVFQVIRWFEGDDAGSRPPQTASSVELERQYYLLKSRGLETKANQASLALQECGADLDQSKAEIERLNRYKDEADRLKREVKRVRDECYTHEREREREQAKEREREKEREKERKSKDQWGGYQLPTGK